MNDNWFLSTFSLIQEYSAACPDDELYPFGQKYAAMSMYLDDGLKASSILSKIFGKVKSPSQRKKNAAANLERLAKNSRSVVTEIFAKAAAQMIIDSEDADKTRMFGLDVSTPEKGEYYSTAKHYLQKTAQNYPQDIYQRIVPYIKRLDRMETRFS
jgi:hypothetical protein